MVFAAWEVVFQVIHDPTVIPDNPPKGVLLRHMEALEIFGEHAEFYFLRPTFEADTMRVFTGAAARDHAQEDKSDILFMAKLYGPVLRSVTSARRIVTAGANAAKFAAWQGLRGLLRLEQTISDQVERRRLRREARAIPSGIHPDTLRALMLRALELDLFPEADAFRQALGSWGRHDLQARWTGTSHGMGLGKLASRSRSESSFLATARSQGARATTVELQAVFREVQELRRWDPITCFEVHDRPGKLWLEAHWYEGADGKHYVHY